MSSAAIDAVRAAKGKRNFGLLAQEVFSLDAAIQWVALEEAGREPRWAWRGPKTGSLCVGTTTYDAELVDPLLLMLAEGSDGSHGHDAITNPHRLLFVVLAYADLVQIVARFGPHAHVSVATDQSIDVNALGARLANLLDRSAQEPLLQ
jgi:hypothetical protein